MDSDYSHMADASTYAIIEQYRKLREGTALEKRMARWNINTTYGKIGKTMSHRDCRNLEEQMYNLRLCGCDRCRKEHYKLRHEYEMTRYYDPPSFTAGLQKAINTEKETPVTTEEPKNYAVKLLVDQLKQQQANLGAKKNSIEMQKQTIKNANDMIKTYNKSKTEIEGKIKELSVALKKLGHKE